ncbi:MAG: hypothetical protein K0R38_5348, partial [Polyangiaceae bacterium]|nr:hypothetical protein [Polyangiaceae bacterium]
MSPKLRSVLARVVLVGGAVFVLTYLGKTAPHDQTVAVRLNGRDVTRIQGIVTKLGDSEPTAGFSQNFSPSMPAPRVVRHAFSAPNGTYIVVINCTEESPAPEEDPSAAGAA